jgi:rubredoxin
MNKQPIYKCRVCGFESNYNLPPEEIKYFDGIEAIASVYLGGNGLSTDNVYFTVCPDCSVVYRDVEKLRVKE